MIRRFHRVIYFLRFTLIYKYFRQFEAMARLTIQIFVIFSWINIIQRFAT